MTSTTCPTCHGKRRFWILLFGFIPWPSRCPTCEGWSSAQPYSPLFSGSGQASSGRAWSRRSSGSTSSRVRQDEKDLPLVVDPFADGDAQPEPQEPSAPDPQGEDTPDDSEAGDPDPQGEAAPDTSEADPDDDLGTAY